MMTPLADAAHLAAMAPPGGVLSPTDDSLGAGYLDLRADPAGVALSKLKTVCGAFGPRLYVQDRLRLVVACGELSPSMAASALAGVLPGAPDGAGPVVAVVRGEDLLGRLEELLLAGCPLHRDVDDSQRPDLLSPPIKAWAPADATIVAEAFAAGARVVVTRYVTPTDAALAVAADDSSIAPAERPFGEVLLDFADGYRLVATLAAESGYARLDEGLPAHVRAGCQFTLQQTDNAARLTLSSQDAKAIFDAARRIELAAPAGSLKRPLAECIETLVERRQTRAPGHLLEYAYDLRPAGEWGEG